MKRILIRMAIIVAIIEVVISIGLTLFGVSHAATTPPNPPVPTVQVGPNPGPGVKCRTVVLRDFIRGRTMAIRMCFRTRPVRVE